MAANPYHRSPSYREGDLEGLYGGTKSETTSIWRCTLEEKWNKLQECLSTRDDRQMIEQTVDSLVTQLEEESACTPENSRPSLLVLNQLVELLSPQFQYTGQLRYINLVIKCQSRAVTLTDDNDQHRGGWISNLGEAHLSRFRRSGDPADLDVSITCHLKALKYTPQEHENMPIIMHSLGNSHYTRFQLTADRADLDKAIEFYTQTLSLTAQGHPHRPGQLDSLGKSYSSRFQKFGELSDIEEAIKLQNQALELVVPTHPSVPGWLHNLGNSYIARFRHAGDLEDINKAIELLSQAVCLTPENHTNMPARLTTLGEAHQSRFMRDGNLDGINQAIEYQTQAMSLTPDDHAYRHLRLGSLGSSYTSRFKHLGKMEDLENAIKLLSQAIALEPVDSEDVAFLVNLGNSYGLRFERFGDLSDIDEAINYLTRAEVLTTDQDAIMSDILTSLGTTYCRRFERLKKLDDINKAVDYQTRALGLRAAGHVDAALLLNNLGVSHAHRFNHLRKEKDMDNALDLMAQALSLLPENHPEMPGIYHNLAGLHNARFKLHSTLQDIDIAIEYQTRVVSLTPEGHSQLPNFTNSLAYIYRLRYEKQGKQDDIDQAIRWSIRSVELTPQENARMPMWLRNLGDSFLERYRNHRDSPSLQSAIECYRACARHLTLSPTIQLHSAVTWAKLATASGLSLPEDEPFRAYQTAIDLVPHVVWLGTNIAQRYQDAQNIKNVASGAAAVAITAQKYGLALEWLEQGRSVVWNQMLQLHNPLDDLAAVDPLIAANLCQVATELHSVSSGLEEHTVPLKDTKSQDEVTQKHHRLAEKYRELVTEARELPGFQDFLRPAKVSTLASAAQGGPLVIVNVDDSRCDALVIRPGTEKITHIPLPKLSSGTVSSIRAELESSLRWSHVRERGIKLKYKGEKKDKFEHVLIMLWTCIAKPVLDALGYQPMSENLPHITWSTTGALSFLPLHAAGYYDRPHAKLSDYAISSYTPTLNTLLSASSSSRDIPHGILAVGQESTPGKSPLPGTRAELTNIKKHVQAPILYSQLDGYHATSQAVLSAMEHHGWIHLACHAYQDIQEPTKSCFFLHDGTLCLDQITRVTSHNKGLAFLSACQTATGDEELPDEAVHLAAGMLMAGYSNVIATMWSIVDEDAPLIADGVYAQLLKGGYMDSREAARALHLAVGQLREKVGDKAFSRWVPYIHMGVGSVPHDA